MGSGRGIVARLKETGAELGPPVGLPKLSFALPDDLCAFYEACGGARLFAEREYATRLLSPEAFEPVDLVMGEGTEPDGTSASWFVFADDESGNLLSIDLSPDRQGWCYDTQIGRYGNPGDCPVIARSFTEFVERTLAAEGGYWYWLRDDFIPYGDAYEG